MATQPLRPSSNLRLRSSLITSTSAGPMGAARLAIIAACLHLSEQTRAYEPHSNVSRAQVRRVDLIVHGLRLGTSMNFFFSVLTLLDFRRCCARYGPKDFARYIAFESTPQLQIAGHLRTDSTSDCRDLNENVPLTMSATDIILRSYVRISRQ